MRIFHAVEAFGGGVYDFLFELVSNMEGHNHLILYGNRDAVKANILRFPENCQFVRWQHAKREISPKSDLLSLFEIKSTISRYNPDIIHLHSSKAGFLGRLAARMLSCQDKVLYTPHGASFLREDIATIKKRIYITLEKLAHRMGGEIVACSRSECQAFRSHGMAASYVNNGISCHPTKLNKNNSGVVTIGTIGRIAVQKNPQLFNEIAKAFQSDGKINFLWVGDGELRDVLNSPNVNVTGWVDPSDTWKYLEDITIYLSTSLWEGLPLSVLQALCAGKPLVLADCVGNIDLIESGNNGYLFTTLDEGVRALGALVNDPMLRKIKGQKSKELLKSKYTLKNMIEGYSKVYDHIIGSS